MSRQWKPVCRVDDIPLLGARRVAREGSPIPIAVFRSAGNQVFALLDRCPHKGGPLSQGIVFGRSVACPLHNWTIGLDDGCAKAPDEGCTPAFACKVEGGQVFLEAGALVVRGEPALGQIEGDRDRAVRAEPVEALAAGPRRIQGDQV